MSHAPAPAAAAPPFADATPLGLIGLTIGCAALLPIAFGAPVTPAGLKTAAMFCLLFGGGCQLVAGLVGFANKNALGGTVMTAFSFNWAMNAWSLWSLAGGVAPDHQVVLATEAASLVLFVPLTWAFGLHSKLLFAFLLDIDLLYACKLARGFFHVTWAGPAIAWLTVGLGAIALYLAVAMLLNPAAGRVVLPLPGPLFAARAAGEPPAP
jgi:succinate-acetate transporter protein